MEETCGAQFGERGSCPSRFPAPPAPKVSKDLSSETFMEALSCRHDLFFNYSFLIWLGWVLVAARRTFQLWHVGSSSLTGNQTHTPCIKSTESFFFFFKFF